MKWRKQREKKASVSRGTSVKKTWIKHWCCLLFDSICCRLIFSRSLVLRLLALSLICFFSFGMSSWWLVWKGKQETCHAKWWHKERERVSEWKLSLSASQRLVMHCTYSCKQVQSFLYFDSSIKYNYFRHHHDSVGPPSPFMVHRRLMRSVIELFSRPFGQSQTNNPSMAQCSILVLD